MQITSEPLGDLCLISELIAESDLAARVEKHFPAHHLWQGVSIGQTLKCLLLYILSESDHRMSHVENWAAARKLSLRWCLGDTGFEPSDVSDDRLGNLLDMFGNDSKWENFHKDHNDSLIKVYGLNSSSNESGCLPIARIDTTTAQSHRGLEGLFQLGYNAHSVSLPQLKIVLLSADTGNFPLSLNVLSGENVDDNVYLPIIERGQKSGLPKTGMLYVGDTKLCNSENMNAIAMSGNYYLGPLSQRQYSTQDLLKACMMISQNMDHVEQVSRVVNPQGDEKAIAMAYELPSQTIELRQCDTVSTYQQRLIASCSLIKRQNQLKHFEEQTEKAIKTIQSRFIISRGRKTLKTEDDARSEVELILKKHALVGLYDILIECPQDQSGACSVQLIPKLDEIEKLKSSFGWRVIATNAPANQLSAIQVILTYWEQYRIEQQFHLLLNKCTALMPIFLKKEKRILALLRILFLALQFSNLWQYRLRSQLAFQDNPFLTDMVPGNPGMKVHNPTTKGILTAFKNIQIIFVKTDEQKKLVQIQGLVSIHHKIISLLKLQSDIYLHPLCQRTG